MKNYIGQRMAFWTVVGQLSAMKGIRSEKVMMKCVCGAEQDLDLTYLQAHKVPTCHKCGRNTNA